MLMVYFEYEVEAVKLFSIIKVKSKVIMKIKFLDAEMFFLDSNDKTFKKNFKVNQIVRRLREFFYGK